MSEWRCCYRIADFDFSLAGVDGGLEELARSLFRGAEVRSGGGSAPLRLERRGGGGILRCGEEVICTAPGLSELFQEIERVLTQIAMEGLQAFFQLHAGVVVHRHGAVLLVGPPDAGKSSLVLGLAEQGALIYTDEVALLSPKLLEVAPFPRDLVVHTGTQQLFADLFAGIEIPPWKRTPDFCYLSLVELNRREVGDAVPATHLLFPDLHLGEEFSVRRLGQGEAARRLLEQPFNLARWEEQGVEAIGRLVENCPALEIRFGDARLTAERLMRVELQF